MGYKRGDPWPEQVSKFFTSQPNELRSKSTGMGSPVLDFLIGGDNSNLEYIIEALKEGSTTTGTHEGRTRKSRSTVEKLKSSLDDGMPAQAVANWVQCDDPKCLKWRKIPWHADVDLLPDKFFCKDNKWSTEPISCDAPEDVWDDNDAPVLRETKNKISEVDFRKGERFDVQRKGKVKFYEAVVIKSDNSAVTKRVFFHFLHHKKEFDEWVDIASSRIAHNRTYTGICVTQYEKQTKFKERSLDAHNIKNIKCDSEIGSKPKTRLTVEESKIESKKEATLTNRQYTEESSNGVVTMVSQIGLEMKNHTLKKDNNISPAHALDFSLTNNTREIGKGLITETMKIEEQKASKDFSTQKA